MGVVTNISAESFPKQGKLLGKAVQVCFNYDTDHQIAGICIRDDRECPFLTILQLKDGRVVLATECQYSYGAFA